MTLRDFHNSPQLMGVLKRGRHTEPPRGKFTLIGDHLPNSNTCNRDRFGRRAYICFWVVMSKGSTAFKRVSRAAL